MTLEDVLLFVLIVLVLVLIRKRLKQVSPGGEDVKRNRHPN
jgi:hypothetical protein